MTHDELVTDPRRRRLILIAMCTALVAVVASVSGLNVAQQAIATDLGASQSTLLWIINGYTLALAALLLPLGAVGDRWGRKRLLVPALVLFVAANALAATAGTTGVLLVARVLAGIAAAGIMPVTLSVITASFPEEDKPTAIATWAGFAGAGGILGLFLSAAIVDNATWPWVFALPVVLGLAALALSIISVGDSREEAGARFDLGGSILSALAIGGLVLGVQEGPERGWTAPLTLGGLVVGAAAMLAFVAWERRQVEPLFDVRLFEDRRLAAGSVSLLVGFGVMFGLFLVLLQFLMAVLGYTALRSATGLLPMAVVMMGGSNLAPRVVERLGTRRTLMAGLGLFTGGLVWFATMVSAAGGYWSLLPGLLVLGAGMALTMTPATTAITGALPAEKQGVASALNDTVRELGGALGVALLGSVLNHGYRTSIVDAGSARLPEQVRGVVESGIGGALAVAQKVGPAADPIVTAARGAFMDGWPAAMWVAVAASALAFGFVAVLGPRDEPAEVAPEAPSGDQMRPASRSSRSAALTA